MAITANRIVKRQGRDGALGSLGVAAGKHLYEGSLAYEDIYGYATDEIVDETTVFLGVVREEVDNTDGSNGDLTAEFWTDGDFDLPVAGGTLVAADVGKTAYGVDNSDVSETATAQPPVGLIKEYVSASVARVAIRGIGQGIVQPGS